MLVHLAAARLRLTPVTPNLITVLEELAAIFAANSSKTVIFVDHGGGVPATTAVSSLEIECTSGKIHRTLADSPTR